MFKCYLIRDGHRDVGTIEECEIIKETSKTFIIKDLRGFIVITRTVRKETMALPNAEIRLTYPEALIRAKELVLSRIAIIGKRIKALQEESELYIKKLKDLESEETGN